jgi:hypothetical protein
MSGDLVDIANKFGEMHSGDVSLSARQWLVLDSAANEFSCFCHVVSRNEQLNELFDGQWWNHEPALRLSRGLRRVRSRGQ